MFLPAISGAEPCTGSNSDGNVRSGFMFAEGAMPIVPVQAGPRSERMSPNRLVATTTSKRSGFSTKRAHRMSMCCLSHAMSGYCAAISAARASHHGMLIEMPLLLVATVSFFSRRCARSKANFSTRSAPLRVKIDVCVTNSRSVPSNIVPPTDEYSPSVFSRTIMKSMSPALRLASGDGTPSNRRAGRRLMYWSNSRRNLSSEPHSEM
ncbi:hypothetical protein AWB83_07035 [Caballeronia ptereochthonis]|uniref:Uncharacterized protein n=1 Tax=Caballeronia ptereochthonis TaxID=1777144 RepID=A0A158ECB1_9BURK|nr:hypothetical protein AWB83_07035 [Caballeronia ptereochthonis]